MSPDNFLSLLQQLLTMLDKNDAESIALAKSILISVKQLADNSHKVNSQTQRMMECAIGDFEMLAKYQEDFAGIPGEYEKNKMKRRRLWYNIMPGC